jgi:hypothetical protein
VSILQAWLIVGIPAMVLAGGLFYGRSRLRTRLGYLVLLVAFAVLTPVDPASGAVLGGVVALLYAAGRGGEAESEPVNTSTIAVPDQTRLPVRTPDETRGG